MLDYQAEALKRVREHALTQQKAFEALVSHFCAPFGVGLSALMGSVLHRPVTINFHPDRYSNNGKTIIENLLEQGRYHGQFRTGTSNGGRTAYAGGERFCWEQRLFFDAYPQNAVDRPKYGALNLFRYIDGASVRFGSCFFTLRQDIINRCTFAYGDSSINPAILCTADTFAGILAGMVDEFRAKGKVLDHVLDTSFTSPGEVLSILLNPCTEEKDLGRNLGYCIEAHIHGDVILDTDIESFHVDGSYQNTRIGEQAEALCVKYGLALRWIPERRIAVDSVGSLFRGAMIPLLAQKIDALFGKQGYINAELLGRASRDSFLYPEKWEDMGGESEVFQYMKQLWHTIGYFG